MNIEHLSINSIRGLLQVELNPDGGNLLIWGSNGSGKSGVVDALDFLFSGDIARLHGEGSQKLSLLNHGHHVLRDTDDASVVADVVVEDAAPPITISGV